MRDSLRLFWRREPVARLALRERAAVASEYVAGHRRRRYPRRDRLARVMRYAGLGLVLGLGLAVADVASAGIGASIAYVGDSLSHVLPVPIIERESRATVEPIAALSAPVLDAIDRVTKDPRLVVSGRVPGLVANATPPGIEIVVNGTLAASPALDTLGRFRATVGLKDGANVIEVAAVRGDARAVAATKSITLDTLPPALTVTKPTDGATVSGPTVQIEGKTELEATVTVNGHAATVAPDGGFVDQVEAVGNPLSIELVARDAAGNETKKTLTLTVQQPAQAVGFVTSVVLDRSTVKAGAAVGVDVFVTDRGAPAKDVLVTVTAGLTAVGVGRTDASGHLRLTFTAPSTEGFVQVVALATANGTVGRGSATLQVTKS